MKGSIATLIKTITTLMMVLLCLSVIAIEEIAVEKIAIEKIAIEKNALTIAFGSCIETPLEQTIWAKIADHNPRLFIFLGDNIYVDTVDEDMFDKAYQRLSNDAYFAKFRASTDFLATWDDNDFGITDGGKDFSGKAAAKRAFIKFFDYPEIRVAQGVDRGIYHSRWLNIDNKKIQVIMLDTRWYRDPLVRTYLSEKQRIALNLGPIQPTLDTTTTILGKSQWLWLENELQKPADLKLLVSSIQVLVEFSGWESWANFPHERQKLLEMIDRYSEDNLLIVSGDIHKAEISQLEFKGRKILEITSSPLAATTYPASNNRHKVGKTLEALNFGIINIEDAEGLTVSASIYDSNGEKKLTATFRSGQ